MKTKEATIVIGITGGIGSGKSTFAQQLRGQGQLVYDTDKAAKQLQNDDPKVIKNIKKLFGEEIYTHNELDRKAVAKIVFDNPQKLKELTDIIHPAVKADFAQWKAKHRQKKLLFMECAILFEGNFDVLVDKIVVITATQETRIARVVARDHTTKENIENRMKNQLSETIKCAKADWIYDTTDSPNITEIANDLLNKINEISKETSKNEDFDIVSKM